jgi:hypothetical protein
LLFKKPFLLFIWRIMSNLDAFPPELRGRKPGQKNLHSKEASRRLAQLGFDPIEKMVKLHEEIEKRIYDMTHHPDGTEKDGTRKVLTMADGSDSPNSYSTMAYSQLLITKQKIINDLMRYGYARVTETTVIEEKKPPVFAIFTTPKGYVAPDMLGDAEDATFTEQPRLPQFAGITRQTDEEEDD